MTTKVLLAYPIPSVASPQKSPCLSILHVGEALRRKGGGEHEVRYYDARWDEYPDLEWPDVVGVSSMTGYQLKGAIQILKDAKRLGKRTILGGIHATMLPDQCLQEEYVDCVVVGEGEQAIFEAIHGGKKQKAIAVNLKTDEMVSPVSPETVKYFRYAAYTGDVMLMASRGCPYRCSFCYIVPFFHNKKGEVRWAKVDLDEWKKDILFLKQSTGFRQMAHGDDWIGPAERLFEILEFTKAQGIKYWPSIRAHQINDEVACRLKELGVEHVSVGIETASPRILKLVDKGNDLDDLRRCVVSLSKHGIWPLFYYISGFPTETQTEINESLDFADWAYEMFGGKLTQNFYAYVPLPGNPLYELVDKSTLPQSMEAWSEFSLNRTHNRQASNLYHIAGLTFHGGKGDKTDRNFPGVYRLAILPFEIMCRIRWKLRMFGWFGLEQRIIDYLLRWASVRYEKRVGTRVGDLGISDVEGMDFGVVENQPDTGARGEFMTGEIKR